MQVKVHCQNRNADWESGGKIVAALSSEIPIILNGGILDHKHAASVMEQTKCHAVMAATGYLQNHPRFKTSPAPISFEPQHLALEYLDLAERHPPPSYLYIQKHLRWIFRDVLQPEYDHAFVKFDYSDWRVKLWKFLVRPYLRSIKQFRLFVALYIQLSCGENSDGVPESIRHLVQGFSLLR